MTNTDTLYCCQACGGEGFEVRQIGFDSDIQTCTVVITVRCRWCQPVEVKLTWAGRA